MHLARVLSRLAKWMDDEYESAVRNLANSYSHNHGRKRICKVLRNDRIERFFFMDFIARLSKIKP